MIIDNFGDLSVEGGIGALLTWIKERGCEDEGWFHVTLRKIQCRARERGNEPSTFMQEFLDSRTTTSSRRILQYEGYMGRQLWDTERLRKIRCSQSACDSTCYP
jgi:hypothetical protein